MDTAGGAYGAALKALRRERAKPLAAGEQPAAAAPRAHKPAAARDALPSERLKKRKRAATTERDAAGLPPPRTQPCSPSGALDVGGRPPSSANVVDSHVNGGRKERVRRQKLHSSSAEVARHEQRRAAAEQKPERQPAPRAEQQAAPALATETLTKRQKLMRSLHLPVQSVVTPAAAPVLSFSADWCVRCVTRSQRKCCRTRAVRAPRVCLLMHF